MPQGITFVASPLVATLLVATMLQQSAVAGKGPFRQARRRAMMASSWQSLKPNAVTPSTPGLKKAAS